MGRIMALLVLGLSLVASGWAMARARTPEPDFAIVVDSPGGATTIRCVRGCKLMWIERGINPNSTPSSSFGFECTGSRCSSATVGGWIAP